MRAIGQVIEGAFFPEVNNERHILCPFEIPAGWLSASDPGRLGRSARPFSIQWWAVCTDDYITPAVKIPRGALVCYREWYGSNGQPNVGLKLTAEEVAEGIVLRETKEPKDLEGKTGITYGVLDPSAFTADGGPSIAERMFKRGVHFRRAVNARVSQRGAMGGWDQVRSRLIGEDGRPMIYFFSTCRDSIRTLPALQHDRDKPEDVDTESEDHAPDSIRYACMSRPYIPEKAGRPPTRILGVGPHNQVTLQDLWDSQPAKRAERI